MTCASWKVKSRRCCDRKNGRLWCDGIFKENRSEWKVDED